MTEPSHSSIIAVDGGGTRCRIALDDGNSVSIVETGSANVSTDFDGSVRRIVDGIAEMSAKTGLAPDRLETLPAYIGLAGMISSDIAERLRSALPFARLRIEDDRPAALRGALGTRDGVIAHCGTGSFFAGQTGSVVRLAGGWGPVLADEASAQWTGRLALRLTLESTDGRVDGTPLSKRLLRDLDGPAGIVRFAGSATPSDFGALAPLVTECAEGGDALARRAMQAGADEIATALRKIGWTGDHVICLTGGIGPHYKDYLPREMRTVITAPDGEPLDGALSLAREFATEVADGCH